MVNTVRIVNPIVDIENNVASVSFGVENGLRWPIRNIYHDLILYKEGSDTALLTMEMTFSVDDELQPDETRRFTVFRFRPEQYGGGPFVAEIKVTDVTDKDRKFLVGGSDAAYANAELTDKQCGV
ncbi:hypothetical protein [Pseudaestuariivita rosea]|uniref:hypothetical protein n=1 Tax=Pseudaestuariivita rosea TaxID=2763263 RepID=UPI001ABA4937|nr:hypothetical protein [Pseudaestuariivita rosea]